MIAGGIGMKISVVLFGVSLVVATASLFANEGIEIVLRRAGMEDAVLVVDPATTAREFRRYLIENLGVDENRLAISIGASSRMEDFSDGRRLDRPLRDFLGLDLGLLDDRKTVQVYSQVGPRVMAAVNTVRFEDLV